MKLSAFAEGVAILVKYVKTREDECCLHAEHDELWIGNEDWDVSEEDRKKLEELGFSISDEGGYHVWT
jgi:hypothetical protein